VSASAALLDQLCYKDSLTSTTDFINFTVLTCKIWRKIGLGHETSMADTETRPRRWQFSLRWDRDDTLIRLETETSRPRPQPWGLGWPSTKPGLLIRGYLSIQLNISTRFGGWMRRYKYSLSSLSSTYNCSYPVSRIVRPTYTNLVHCKLLFCVNM